MSNTCQQGVSGKWVITLAAFLLLSLLYCVWQLVHIDRNTYADFPIFYQAVQQYLDSGILYTRNLEHYYPASGIYKFPAVYSSFLLPWVKSGISLEMTQTFLLYLHMGLYVASLALLVWIWAPANSRILFGLLSGIFSFNLYALYENLHALQLEIYILFFLSLTLFLLNRQRYLLSGIVIAVVSFLKVYPVFLLTYFLWKRKWKFFAGFFLTSLLLVLLMIACFGLTENQWYFFHALPVMLQEGAFINHENVGVEKLINHLFSTSQFIHYETPLGVGSAAITKIILWTCYLLGVFAFFRKGNVLGSNNQYPHYMAFSLLLTLAILTLKNPWSNYQVLLVIPMLYILSLLMPLPAKKFVIFVFVLTWVLLFLSPENKSLFFSCFAETGNPLFMGILSLLNNKLFAIRGAATLLVYLMLVSLLLNRKATSRE